MRLADFQTNGRRIGRACSTVGTNVLVGAAGRGEAAGGAYTPVRPGYATATPVRHTGVCILSRGRVSNAPAFRGSESPSRISLLGGALASLSRFLNGGPGNYII